MLALQLSEDGKTVINTILVGEDGDLAGFSAIAAPHDGIGIGWTLVDGEWVAPVMVLTPEETKAMIAAEVQAYIDATARSRGYDSGLSCASYDGDPSAKFDGEAKAFKAWRSAVWTACYATLAAVEGGADVPTAESLIAGLPAIAWPD